MLQLHRALHLQGFLSTLLLLFLLFYIDLFVRVWLFFLFGFFFVSFFLISPFCIWDDEKALVWLQIFALQ